MMHRVCLSGREGLFFGPAYAHPRPFRWVLVQRVDDYGITVTHFSFVVDACFFLSGSTNAALKTSQNVSSREFFGPT